MKVHFIAIGGSIMHNLAIELAQKGNVVTGSDNEIFDPAKSTLAHYKLLPGKIGWDENNITEDIDAVILGMHAKVDNPELNRALLLKIPIYSFPEFVFSQVSNQTRVVVAGSHGKTTITSMILHILNSLNYSPNYIVGASIKGLDLQVRLDPKSNVAVLEGDEYLSSPLDKKSKFLHYDPQILVLSGIAWDHYNVFPTFDSYLAPFKELLNNLSDNATIVANMQDENIEKLASDISSKGLNVIPYVAIDHKINDGTTYLLVDGMEIEIPFFGIHNLMNASAALHTVETLGVDKLEAAKTLSTFEGASSRLELIHKSNTLRVYKDFAHAPSKARAVINSVREQFPAHHLVACLELHTYSSLNKDFIDHYEGVMHGADTKVVFFDTHALELKGLKLSKQDILSAFGDEDILIYSDAAELKTFLATIKLSKHIFLMMSSGNFGSLDIKRIF